MIRVLRVLEYEYVDADTMSRDMGAWHVGANATYSPSERVTIRSAVLLPQVVVE